MVGLNAMDQPQGPHRVLPQVRELAHHEWRQQHDDGQDVHWWGRDHGLLLHGDRQLPRRAGWCFTAISCSFDHRRYSHFGLSWYSFDHSRPTRFGSGWIDRYCLRGRPANCRILIRHPPGLLLSSVTEYQANVDSICSTDSSGFSPDNKSPLGRGRTMLCRWHRHFKRSAKDGPLLTAFMRSQFSP